MIEYRQDSIVDSKNGKMSLLTSCVFGPAVLVTFIIVIYLAVAFFDKQEVNDYFQDIFTSKVSVNAKPMVTGAPEVFTKNLKTTPGNCYPYAGCFYPSEFSNPENLNTGKRDPVSNDEIWCEKAWRDCSAYQDCIGGKCVHKESI
jgi:hypothetical protein